LDHSSGSKHYALAFGNSSAKSPKRTVARPNLIHDYFVADGSNKDHVATEYFKPKKWDAKVETADARFVFQRHAMHKGLYGHNVVVGYNFLPI
jgi:hypothetical protein